MGELRRSEQDTQGGGTYTTDGMLGGYIGELDGMFMPARDARDGGVHHDVSFVDMMDSLVRRTSTAFGAYVYKDSADAYNECSVTPFALLYRELLCTFAGETAITLTPGQANYIWVDLSAAPTITIHVGTDWPSSPPIPHLRLDVITPPAGAHWTEEHRARHLRTQAVTPFGGQVHLLRSHVIATGTPSVSPVTIGTVPGECVVGSCKVLVRVPFDGTGMSLSIGDASDANRLMLTSEVDLSSAGTYTADRLHYYSSQADVLATFDLGGSTAGIAHVFVEQR